MVSELQQKKTQQINFPETAPAASPVFFRTYSRKDKQERETWEQVCNRSIQGLKELGSLNAEETELLYRMMYPLNSLPSGRWLWVGGTDWIKQEQNFSGAYNCTSTNVIDWEAFGLMMDLAMQGCGTGAVLEPKYIDKLPVIKNKLEIIIEGELGSTPIEQRREQTEVKILGDKVYINVGDSRQGWVKSYQTLLEIASDPQFDGEVEAIINLSDVRPAGEPLKGFGGVANPVKLTDLYYRCSRILNGSVGRKLNSVECCLLIDEAAVTIVAGNIRRCIPSGALVYSESGLVPIEKIRIGDRVLTSKGFYPVTNFFAQGVQSLCRIKTQDSYFDCTPEHKVAVLEDVYGKYRMIEAKYLREGDRLVFVPQSIPGTATELPEFKDKLVSYAKKITIPALTSDVAYFIGYLHGDGSVGSDGWRVRFRISEDQQQIIDKLINIGKLFGLDTYTLRTPEQCKAKAFELQFNSSALNQYLSQFKQPFSSIRIPDCILLGTKNIREAYLAGLADADGCFSQSVLVASVYPDFLRQVQAIYGSLGITTRLCESIRKRTGKWEGELVTVGEAAFEQTSTLFSAYSLRFAHSNKSRPKSFKDHGFPKEMIKPLVNTSQYHWGKVHKQMTLPTVKKYIPESTNLIPIKVKSVELDVRISHTYDLEVASIHEFVCEGILVSNSAGMRQGSSKDELFSGAKDNLWQQDENGNWRIDPTRDALRMANHSRVFHHKPTLEETIKAVRKQYYSGEGAIQYAPEAILRSNIDLFPNGEVREEFSQAYLNNQGKEWLQNHYPEMSEREINHRLGRYGLNPCITSDTWIHTEYGARQVKDLIGKQFSVYVNGELFSTTKEGFWETGVKKVYKLITQEGYELRLTDNHQLLKITAQTQNHQYSEWCEVKNLQIGDRLLIHNHRDIKPWDGTGNFEEGWLLGNLIGDGCFSVHESTYQYQAKLRYWGETQLEMKDYALSLVNNLPQSIKVTKPLQGCYHSHNSYYEIGSASLAKLANQFNIQHQANSWCSCPSEETSEVAASANITSDIEQGSYNFYCGFLRGLFDADGSVQGTQNKGVSIRLAQSNINTLKSVQRMLARLGIISKIYQNRRQAGLRYLPDSNRDLKPYFCQAQHELIISNDNLPFFQKLIGFQDPKKSQLLEELLTGYRRNYNRERFTVKIKEIVPDGIESVYDCTVPAVSRFDANGIVAHNCGEILGADFHCNLSEIHLNQIDPFNYQDQDDAFKAGAISVATLLNHRFEVERYRYSREIDPIVGVSFTGLFDFFVHAFGVEWLQWWADGRPNTSEGMAFKEKEAEYLSRWQEVVHQTVWDYCDRHNLRRPNRCTTVQPSGTKSLLTGASPGWHPPKSQRFIRRITFRKNDPVALACFDYGYSIVPSQSDKDENGNLLNDAFDPRCTEWLVEIPTEVSWANLPGADQIEIGKFSALAQFDFYMQVQKHYTTHNTSATVELREQEIEPLGKAIYEAIKNDEGYISAALLARFDDHQTFPRLPFEPIDKETYDRLSQEVIQRRKIADFHQALTNYDSGYLTEAGPAGCDSDKCLLPEQTPDS